MTYQQAIAGLASLERLDLIPAQPGFTSAPENHAEGMLRLAGPQVIPLIEAALPSASRTGRIALLRIVIDLDRARAVPLVAAHVDDTTPVVVNTCLVGFVPWRSGRRTLCAGSTPRSRARKTSQRRRTQPSSAGNAGAWRHESYRWSCSRCCSPGFI